MEKDVRKNMNEKYITLNSILESKSSQPSWNNYRMDEIYTERKEPGEEGLPVLSVSIHSGVSDGELDEEELGKKVKRIADKTQYRKAMAGDLVFNMMRAWQGAIGVVKTDGMVSPAYIVAKSNDKVWPLFMDYYMKTPRMIETIHRQSYGVTGFRLRLYWDSFAPIRCTLPPIEEQRRIAEILLTQDRVIELYGRKIEELQRFKKGALSKMFPEPGHNTPEVRFPGFTNAWEQRKLSELAEIIGGGTPDTNNPDYWDGDIDWYAPAEMEGQRYAKSSVRKITELGLQNSSAKILPAYKTVLFTSRAGIGKMAILQHPAATNQGFQSLVLNDGIDPYFIYTMGGRIKDMAEGVASGSTFPEISGKMLGKLEVMIPTLEEQKGIVSLFRGIDDYITLHQRKRDEEVRKKKALMQILLTGIRRFKT